MTNVTGVKGTDIGHISARHHQCEVDGEDGVDEGDEGTEEVEEGDRDVRWLCWCRRNQQLQVLHCNQCL